jgi:hypothetical protein
MFQPNNRYRIATFTLPIKGVMHYVIDTDNPLDWKIIHSTQVKTEAEKFVQERIEAELYWEAIRTMTLQACLQSK